MTTAEWATWVGAIATLAGFGIATVQLRGLRSDRVRAREADLRGVAVSIDVVRKPTEADAAYGVHWVYRFTVVNPGSLPISDVVVEVRFPVDVRRRHYDNSVDEPGRDIEMRTPVVPGGGRKSWERKLLIDASARHVVQRSTATVTFDIPDAGRLKTLWPMVTSQARSAPVGRRVRDLRATR